MKKLIVGLAALAVLVTPLTAGAHGTPTVTSVKPRQISASGLEYKGIVNFGVGNIHGISQWVDLQRRTPGGSWTIVETAHNTLNDFKLSTTGTFALDCHKDYRSVVRGAADPGQHAWLGFNSPILTHTC